MSTNTPDTETVQHEMPSYSGLSARPTKKARKHDYVNKQKLSRDYLTFLPLEILAEVLSYTNPYDILSVARTSKFFCHTLVGPSSDFIWKRARANCSPVAIPDPTPNFTEASYAAFLFDDGECEVCKKKCKSMFASFTLRLRLCDKAECRTSWRENTILVRPTDVPRYRLVAERLVRVEFTDYGYSRTYEQSLLVDIPSPEFFTFRKSQWQAAVDGYNRARADPDSLARYKLQQVSAVSKLERLMKHGVELINFRVRWEEEKKRIRRANLNTAKTMAQRAGWSMGNLLQAPTFNLLYQSKNRSLVMLQAIDFKKIRSAVELEIADIAKKEQRRTHEEQYRERRSLVAEHYNKLRTSGEAGSTLPTLTEFRKLPVVKYLQNDLPTTSNTSFSEELQRPFAVQMIRQDLDQWRDNARTTLGQLLGSSSWKATSPNKLHPVERPNIRFRCLKCDARTASAGFCRSLNFAEVCQHQCSWLDKKQQAKAVWKVTNFRLDSQASAVVDQLLKCIGANAEDRESLQAVEKIGMCIRCLTCPTGVTMDYEMMLSHCSRHEHMRIEVLQPSESNPLSTTVERGLCAQLTKRSPSAAALRARRIYGCRHCQQTLQVGSDSETEGAGAPNTALSAAPHESHASTAAEPGEVVEEKTRGSQPKAGQRRPFRMFNFDGLRSHVREKHGIICIGDEDLCRMDGTALGSSE